MNWRLDDGRPVSKQPWKPIAAVDRAAKPGDLLFGNKLRDSFTCVDGSRLVRTGSHLERISADGRVTVTYASPWFLRPFTIPWPMATALILFFLISYLDNRMKELSKQNPGTPCLRQVIVDAAASIVLLALIGGIWHVGLMFLITLNNDYLPEGSSWKTLVLVPMIIWFFGGPLVFVKTWKILQKSLAMRFNRSLLSPNGQGAGSEGRAMHGEEIN